MSIQPTKSINPGNEKLIDQQLELIYKAASLYKYFLIPDNNKIEKDNVYMISKEYMDNFKEKIKYNDSIDLFQEKFNEEKCEEFKGEMKKYSLNDLNVLNEIIYEDVKVFGNLDDVEENIDKGFDFVSKEFLDTIELDFTDADFNDYKVQYIQDSNSKIIIFKDETKLLITTVDDKVKYHAIPAPIKMEPDKNNDKKKSIRRTKTLIIRNRKRKTNL